MRVQLAAPAAAVVFALLCLAIAVSGGIHPLTSRSNWRWSWESPPTAFVGYAILVAAILGVSATAWRSLRQGRWLHVGLAIFFVGLTAAGVLVVWRAGSWLPDFRAEVLPDPAAGRWRSRSV